MWSVAERSGSRHAQRGLAAVEMAIVLPVFLMLLLGTAELGRACFQYNALLKAAHEGARYIAADARNGAGEIDLDESRKATARTLVVYGNPAGAGTPVVDGLTRNAVAVNVVDADHVAVVITYRFQPMLAAIPTFGSGDGITIGRLVASAVMEAM